MRKFYGDYRDFFYGSSKNMVRGSLLKNIIDNMENHKSINN